MANEKNVFEVFKEMNLEDEKNKTSLLGVYTTLVSAQVVQNGKNGHVTIGVEPRTVLDLTTSGKRAILLVYSHEELLKRLPAEPQREIDWTAVHIKLDEIIGDDKELRQRLIKLFEELLNNRNA